MGSFIGQKITQSVHLLRLLSLLALSLLLYSIGLAGPYSTSGSGSVSPSGAYTYTVPIALPVGSAGITPQFNLVFDSNSSGNGLLGRGWNLSGFSQITRCGKAISTDGIKSGIRFYTSDNYCLNGQRLFLKSGTHGSNGAEYVTEQATHSRIVLYTNDALSGGAHYFKMWTKTGDIITFGSPDTSKGIRITRAGTTMIYAWPATRIEDRSGNYIKIEYRQETANNLSYHPLAVRWSGNEALDLVPYNTMSLIYETRPERRRGYHLGHEIYSDKRLDSIKIYTDSQLINTYEIDYSAATALTPSQVTLIRVCASDNDCNYPLNFSWPLWPTPNSDNPLDDSDTDATSAGVETVFSIVGTPTTVAATSIPIDLTVTSKIDLSQLLTVQSLQTIRNLGIEDSVIEDGYEGTSDLGSPFASLRYYSRFKYLSGDFDGDGRTELLQPKQFGVRILDYVGDGKFNSTYIFRPRAYDMRGESGRTYLFNFQSGDYNGDGLSDLLHVSGDNSATVWFSGGDSTFTQVDAHLSDMIGSETNYFHRYKMYNGGDFNGDGRSDIFHATDLDAGRVLLSAGDGTFSTITIDIATRVANTDTDTETEYAEYKYVLGDYNGDGLTDIFQAINDSTVLIYFADGDGTFTKSANALPETGYDAKAGNSDETYYQYSAGDFNGDGLTDLFHISSPTLSRVWLSKGDGTFALGAAITNNIAGITNYHLNFIDINGDGSTDIWHIKSETETQQWLSTGDGGFALSQVSTLGFNLKGTDTASDGIGSASVVPKGDPIEYLFMSGDFNGNGAMDYVHFKDKDELRILESTLTPASYQLETVKTEGGTDITITYESLSGLENTFYEKGTTSLSYPTTHVTAPIYAVSELSTEGSDNDYYGTSYRYKNLRADLERGLEGFGSFISRDDETGIETEISYIQSFPYTGLATLAVQTDTESDVELSRIENNYTVKIVPLTLEQSSYEIYLSKRKEIGNDLNGASLPTIETHNWYGANGNLLALSVSASDGWGQLTHNTYAADVGTHRRWLLGLLVTSIVRSWKPDTRTLTRELSFGYSTKTGYLERETIEPNTPVLSSSKNYERDAFGNIVMSRVNAHGIDTRLESSIAYDSRGRFIIQESNALGHIQIYGYDERLGNISTLTGANGLKTKWEYDNWGRATLEILPDGTWSSTIYGKCDDTCPSAASYYIRHQDITGSDSYAYYDEWDRKLETRSNGFDTDTWIVNKILYDRWGRVTHRSMPHHSGATDISWVKTEYDKLGRPTKIILPNNASTRYEYNGLETMEIDALEHRKLTRKDSKGNIVEVIEYGDQYVEPNIIDEIASGDSHIFSGNYDGISGDELLLYRNGLLNYRMLNITSNTITEQAFVPGGVSLSPLALAFDWNNDDIADIVDIDSSNNIIHVHSSSTSEWQTESYTLTTDLSSDKTAYMLSDYDRDGKLELGHHRGGGTIDIYESDGASLTITYSVSDSLSDCAAVTYQGAGTQDDPYLIRDICELQNITLNLSANYQLDNDIDARVTRSWEQITVRGETTLTLSGFTPIGTFSGALDGANHIIRGMYINHSGQANVGLFSQINGGTVRRIGLVESEHIYQSLVTSQASVVSNNGKGLLVGMLGGNSNEFADIWISGTSSNGASGVGGLIGVVTTHVNAKIANVGVSVSITNTDYAGGLIGLYANYGKLISTNANFPNQLTVTNSYTIGSIEATTFVGGFYGYIGNTKIVASHNYSRVLATSPSFSGGIVGLIWTSGKEFSDVYWDLDLIHRGSYNELAGISGLTSEQLTCPTASNNTTCKSGETLYANWSDAIWYFGTKKEAPLLRTTPKGYREGWIVGDFDNDGVVDSFKADTKVLFMSNSTTAEAEETLSALKSGDSITVANVTVKPTITPSVPPITLSSEIASGNSHVFSGNYDDIDGDELLLYRNGAANYKILNIGSNTATEKAFVPGGVSLSPLALAFDWNNDDKTDIVDIDANNNIIRVHSSSTSEWQTHSYTLTTDLSSDKKAYMLSDYDRDGNIELGHHRGGGTVDVYESNGTSLTVTYSVSNSPSSCAAVTEYQGAGTQDDPYLIRDICELQKITLNLSANYRLANDIDARMTRASGRVTVKGDMTLTLSDFTPIGPFSGELDGANHIIRGMYISRGGEANVGLFSQINGGTVRRIGLVESEHIYQSAATRQGFLIANNGKGLLVGMVGGNSNNNEFEDIWISGTSNGGASGVGGLIGVVTSHVNAKIANVGVSVSITNSDYAGGLIGSYSKFISTNTGLSSQLTVTNSYAIGSIAATTVVGGLYGHINDTNIVASHNYSRVRVLARAVSSNFSGGIVGLLLPSHEKFSDVYWDLDSSARPIGLGTEPAGISGLTSEQLTCPTAANNTTCKSGETLYTNWSDAIWYFGTEKEAPILRTTPKGYREGWIVGDFDGDEVVDSLKADLKVLFMSNSTPAETEETLSALQSGTIIPVASVTVKPTPIPTPPVLPIAISSEIASGNSHIFSGNYDGIGGDELLSYRNGAANYKILNITSNTVTEHAFIPGGVSLSPLVLAFDWDNDNKTDIIDIDANNNIIRVYSSPASEWQTHSYTLTTDLSSDKKAYMLSDYDRDDKIELGHHRGGGTVDVYESAGASLTVTYSVSDSLSDCAAVSSHQGAGTKDNPYLIRDICELQNITLNLSANYQLANDIDARMTRAWERVTVVEGWRTTTTITVSGFAPINGSGYNAFSGELDGANHIIRGMYINLRGSTEAAGLFSQIDGATVRRIGLVESEYTANYGGLLVFYLIKENKLEDIWVSGKISDIDDSIGFGGLIGYAFLGNSKIANVGASVSIAHSGVGTGGLIGSYSYSNLVFSPLTVINSYVNVSFDGEHNREREGGLFGELLHNTNHVVLVSNSYARAHNPDGQVPPAPFRHGDSIFSGVYWDRGIDSDVSYHQSDGIIGLTSEKLTCPTAANNTTCQSGKTLYADWSEDIWYFGTKKEAPILRTTPKGHREGWIVGDFDGDDVVDSLKTDGKVLFMSNSTAAETVKPTSPPTSSVRPTTISSEIASGNLHVFSGNYDGIAGDELLSYRNGSVNYKILNINSDTVTEQAFVLGGVSLSPLALAFDWNNDDKTDIVDIDSINNIIRVYSSSASEWQTHSYTLTTDLSSDKKAYMLSDYDRDDKIELGHHRGGGTVDVYESHGASLTVTYSVSDSLSDCAAVSSHQGAGTQDNPYLIRDICELQNITLNLLANYQLANDIDARMTRSWRRLTVIETREGRWRSGPTLRITLTVSDFTPIGPFSGELDGANHVIRGMYINRGNEGNVGLFSQINGGSVRRIGLVESEHIYVGTDASTPSTTDNKGLLVGLLTGSNISQLEDIWISGTSDGRSNRIGGLVGHVQHANAKIANVGVSVSITEVSGSAGGLIGIYSGRQLTVTNSYATGSIEGEDEGEGGDFVGGLYGAIRNGNFVVSHNYSRVLVMARLAWGNGGVGGSIWGNRLNFSGIYWDWNLIGWSGYRGSKIAGISGLTSEQLTCPTAANNTTCKSGEMLYAGWPEDIWYFGTEKEAPILRTTPKGYREGWIVGDFDNDDVVDSLKTDIKVLFMSNSTAAETEETLLTLQAAAQTLIPTPTPDDNLNPNLNHTIPFISHRYNAHDNLLETRDRAGNIISVTYDRLDRKIALDDPDLGNWRYFYDGLGQLTLQIDAKNQRSYNHYDKLGRVTRVQENSMTVVNTYDSGNKAIGKLSSTRSGNNYRRSQVYDDYGRLIQSTIGLDSDYVISVSYDTAGRIQSRHWPTGFAITMNYTAGGHLLNVIGSDGIKYLDIKTVDAHGNLVGFVYGNQVSTTVTYDDLGRLTDISSGLNGSVQNKSYEFDLIGNITSRIDSNLNHIETFRYDAWNRLTENRLRGVNTLWTGIDAKNIQRVSYNALGNITYKSDVGNYTYNADKPHAVASVSGIKNHSYKYDANGNQISGAGRNIRYTSFNKVSRLSALKDGVSATYRYEYGSEKQRVKEQKGEAETYYINPEGSGLFYEKAIVGGGLSVTHKHYIKVGGILVAVKEQVENATGTSYSTKYFYPDYLGSTDVISDEAGIVSHRNSYDAWGKRRHATVQANGSVEDTNGSIISTITRRGYTEHEHIDGASLGSGLINANGRLYDPLLGRFLQAPPELQAPGSTQNYNRYSYVLNNPLSYTSPTGHNYKRSHSRFNVNIFNYDFSQLDKTPSDISMNDSDRPNNFISFSDNTDGLNHYFYIGHQFNINLFITDNPQSWRISPLLGILYSSNSN